MGRFCDNARGKITNWDVSTGNKWQLAPEVPLITCSGFNVKSFPDSERLTGFALKVSFMRGSCWNSRWNVYIDPLKSYFLLRNVLTLRGNCRQVAFETEPQSMQINRNPDEPNTESWTNKATWPLMCRCMSSWHVWAWRSQLTDTGT